MIDKVKAFVQEHDDLQKQLQDPAVYGDQKEVAKISRRIKQLDPITKKYAEYKQAEDTIAEVENVKDDPDLLLIAKEEASIARMKIERLEDELKRLLVPRDPNDEKSVILEVRAGTGGEEAALFAAEQLKMYLRYAENKGWKVELMDTSAADAGGIKEASARIEGDGVYGDLKYESGVHRVQRIPATENKGRVHTSTTTVAILPEAEEVDMEVRNEDLRIDTYRAGGAGGQHVNKTESAVRLTHIPTGVVVACQTERSQIKNRALAMSLLRSRLYAAEQERLAKERGDMRAGQVGSGDRSEKIRTYNFPQDRITDHRINQNFSNIPKVMEGELDDLISALKIYQEQELLKKL
ncbi:MAG: peptide chain release factor 1 [Candidatus Peribacteraceae bacterium]|nr:peptide chain release factor 1 [Candidatus Peribacteraceae bacterium]